jgi:hypothetical protein
MASKSEITEFWRECPKCGEKVYYASTKRLRYALSSNKNCVQCAQVTTAKRIKLSNQIGRERFGEFFGYVDRTLKGEPFYVGIGNLERTENFNRKNRNKLHGRVSDEHGIVRKIELYTNDWEIAKLWEVQMIDEYGTFHYDHPIGHGCNFTRGGDGVLGWHPSPETRLKMRLAKLGKKRTPEQIAASAAGMRGKKRGPYKNTGTIGRKLGPFTPEHIAKQRASRRANRLAKLAKENT